MIAANEAVATLLDAAQGARRCTACTSAPSRARSSAWSSSSRRWACRRRRCPSTMSPHAGGRRRRRECSRMRRRARAAHRPRARAALTLARAALAQAGALLAAQPRPRRAALAALLPLHLADPPLPRPRLPPRAAVAPSAAGRTRRARRSSTRRASGRSARERDAMTIERDADDVARCFLLERELFERGWRREFDGEVDRADRRGRVRRVRRRATRACCPCRRLRGDWWELNEEGTILRGDAAGSAMRLGDPVRVRVERVDAPRGRVDLVARRLGSAC